MNEKLLYDMPSKCPFRSAKDVERRQGNQRRRESNELSKESLGFSLYIFYDACDVKIKSNPSPQGFSVCRSDAKKETTHLAGWRALTPAF